MIKNLGRAYITTAPVEVYKASRPTIIKVWVPAKLHSDEQFEYASVVVIADTIESCQLEKGVPLPFDTVIEVELDAGKSLWAASFNRAFMGYSAVRKP
jgi:hypothetical protein